MLTKLSFGIALVLCVSCSSDTASTTVQDETDLGAPADFGRDTMTDGESDGSSMNADSGGRDGARTVRADPHESLLQ